MKPKSKPANLLDLMSPAEQEAVAKREQARSNGVTSEWMSLAELGVHFGWQAVRDVMNDIITLDQASLLIQGARKIHASNIYDQALASLAANSQQKGGFNKIMKPFIKQMRDIK